MEPLYSVSPEIYKLSRPEYGDDIYNHLQSLVKTNGLAWDCACGSGQASVHVAGFMDRVIATDVDRCQIEVASHHPKVEYIVGAEMISSIESDSVDLITVATAIHWLDHDKFYKEVDRVLKKDGVFAVWGYTGLHLNKEIDPVLESIVEKYFMPYYSDKIKIAFEGYGEVELPYTNMEVPDFKVSYDWTFEQFKNYLLSFSAMQNFTQLNGGDGFYLFEEELKKGWGQGLEKPRKLTWDLITKISIK